MKLLRTIRYLLMASPEDRKKLFNDIKVCLGW